MAQAGSDNSEKSTSPASSEMHGIPLVLVTACAMMAVVMQVLDGTIANVALPYMQGTMGVSQDEINWVLTSYIVATAIMMAPVGFLTSRFGRTRVYVASVVGFTIASILCGLSQSLEQIVIFRILQGFCGATLVPLSQAVMFDIYPPERRSFSMSIWSIGVTVGPIMGPILGGWLTAHYSWRWVFYVNIPFGILTALGFLFFLKETPPNKTVKLDWIGFGALSLAIGALQLVLDRGEELDWFSSPEVVVEAGLAALGLYVFLVQFFLAEEPFLSPRLFRDRNFFAGAVFIFVVGLLIYTTLALMAPYLQLLMNYPVTTAGLALAPRGSGTIIAALVCGRLVNILGARFFIFCGFAASACALYAVTLWTPDVSEPTVIITGILQGFGSGCIFIPLSLVAFATLPGQLRTQAAGVMSLLRNLGSSIGISVTSALLLTNTQVNHAVISAAVTPFAHGLQTGMPGHFWNPQFPAGAMALNQEITRQASIISYIDDYKLMLVVTLMAFPFILLIREVRARAAAVKTS